MGHLGEFGVQKEPEVDTFGYFGATLRTHPDLTDLAALEAIEGVRGAKDRTSVHAALKTLVSTLVHPEDADVCWRLALENRQGIGEISDLAARLLEAATDRPFSQPVGSSDGQPTTDTNSEAVSDSPALRVLEGRPDLQVAVARAQRAG